MNTSLHRQHVVVAGAGIGGLTTALTLNAHGIPATIIERADTPQRLQVGMTLQANAVREIFELGLGAQLADLGVATTSITYFTDQGRQLYREPRGLEGGYGYPQYEVNRATLLSILETAVEARIGPESVRTGTVVRGFQPSADGVHVHTTTGDVFARALVGADGLHSAVRAQLHPADDPVLWSGVRMFRGASHRPPFLDGLTLAIVKGAGGVDLVTYPIGGGVISWVLMVPVAEPGALPANTVFNEPVDPAAVVPHVAEWDLGWLDVDDLISTSEFVLNYPQVDRDPLSQWGTGPVTLLGDAAHPMYPLGGNGGSQAIVDARVLAEEVAAGVNEGSLRRYESRRRAVTADVVGANRAMRAAALTDPRGLAQATDQYRRATHADDTVTASTARMHR